MLMLKAVVAPDDGSSTARRRSSADKEESAYSSEGFTFLGMVHHYMHCGALYFIGVYYIIAVLLWQ
jgi:hypothetical protein